MRAYKFMKNACAADLLNRCKRDDFETDFMQRLTRHQTICYWIAVEFPYEGVAAPHTHTHTLKNASFEIQMIDLI